MFHTPIRWFKPLNATPEDACEERFAQNPGIMFFHPPFLILSKKSLCVITFKRGHAVLNTVSPRTKVLIVMENIQFFDVRASGRDRLPDWRLCLREKQKWFEIIRDSYGGVADSICCTNVAETRTRHLCWSHDKRAFDFWNWLSSEKTKHCLHVQHVVTDIVISLYC